MRNPAGSPIAPSEEKDVVNILLVDDEGRNLDVLESILAAPNYRLVRTQTAQEALMALIDGEFAAIVLDIQMPGTNGIELAHLIKHRKRTQHIPIIFLTAYFQEDKDILHGYEVGAVDYLTKPIDSIILKSKIAVFVELFQKNRELAHLNRAMENEIAQRQKAEEALRQANNELEARVQERIAAHAELTQQKEIQTRLYDATLSSITDLAYTFDLEGNWIYANKPLLEIWGKTLPEIVGKSSWELGYPPELAERLRDQVKQVIRTRKPFRGETFFTSAAGVEDYHEYIFSPVFAADGTVSAVCGTTRLTTERKRAEREIEIARDKALAASRAKDDFLAALSHELRTPLNPVLLLASDAAENPDLPAEIRAQFATIRNNVELEARLIDDLLDITRITHGKLRLNKQSVEVSAVLREAIATVRGEIDEKQITLHLQLAAHPAAMQGDSVRLQQIFWNVLKNAVKFTPAGGSVTVKTQVEQDKISVHIIDTGIGMTPQEIAHIFTAFSQGEHATTQGIHRFGGMGLGLAISKMLAEMHDGVIYATSRGRDQGATFSIELPLATPEKKSSPPPANWNTPQNPALQKKQACGSC